MEGLKCETLAKPMSDKRVPAQKASDKSPASGDGKQSDGKRDSHTELFEVVIRKTKCAKWVVSG